MHRNRSVDVHQFAMVPRADIPRSSFRMQHTHKTTFNAGQLIPVFCEEVLPGDTFRLKMTAFARLSTPIYPLMDNMYLDSFFFFVPNRLVWSNWQHFMGEKDAPTDSTTYAVPVVTSPTDGFVPYSLFDYMGAACTGQILAGNTINVNALPFRAYSLIYNQWFRDENIQQPIALTAGAPPGDGPDTASQYAIVNRGKRHDYFTSCLPWPQKGASVSLPLGTQAEIKTSAAGGGMVANFPFFRNVTGGTPFTTGAVAATTGPAMTVGGTGAYFDPNGSLYADLSTATAATINQLRQAFQIQKLLERDARGGTRYTEIIRAHFGVTSPDARLQRAEYLGGGSSAVTINPIAQTSATGVSGGTTPQGHLSAIGTALISGHGFSQSFTEHGFVLGLVSVRADLTYQQGQRRLLHRLTRYDYYFPAFAMLGEQAVLNKEIYATGTPSQDTAVFGYQERWAEYRYHPSRVSGAFRSTTSGTLDAWHLAQKFTALPTLSDEFIIENPPIERIVAGGSATNHQQFIFDSFFDVIAARPLPMYSVPGLIDHF